MIKILKFLGTYLGGLFILVAKTSLISLITLNLTFTYPWMVSAFNIESATGLTVDVLYMNYRQIINYLNFPWHLTLYMPDFPMSDTGEFHFWEVMVIFRWLQVIVIVFILWLLIVWQRKLSVFKLFNAFANLTFIIFGLLLVTMLIDFDFFFYWFHRAFFNNDYWLFNPSTDPVIRALPAELFMVKGLIMIVLLFLISGLCKAVHRHKKKNLTS